MLCPGAEWGVAAEERPARLPPLETANAMENARVDGSAEPRTGVYTQPACAKPTVHARLEVHHQAEVGVTVRLVQNTETQAWNVTAAVFHCTWPAGLEEPPEA